MENGQDQKPRDKQVPGEEIFGELDAMYQRVADIEKEEAIDVSNQEEAKNKSRGALKWDQRTNPGGMESDLIVPSFWEQSLSYSPLSWR